MKTNTSIVITGIVGCAAIIAYIYFAFGPMMELPHLDPPVIVGHNECGSKLDTATVAALFATIGYDFRMESVGRCEKAFYIYRREAHKRRRESSWSQIKSIGGLK